MPITPLDKTDITHLLNVLIREHEIISDNKKEMLEKLGGLKEFYSVMTNIEDKNVKYVYQFDPANQKKYQELINPIETHLSQTITAGVSLHNQLYGMERNFSDNPTGVSSPVGTHVQTAALQAPPKKPWYQGIFGGGQQQTIHDDNSPYIRALPLLDEVLHCGTFLSRFLDWHQSGVNRSVYLKLNARYSVYLYLQLDDFLKVRLSHRLFKIINFGFAEGLKSEKLEVSKVVSQAIKQQEAHRGEPDFSQ